MKISVSDKVYAIASFDSFNLFEDRSLLVNVGKYTILHDCLAMLELFQQHYEVSQCLRKTSVKSTYQMLLKERDLLQAQIDRIQSANK